MDSVFWYGLGIGAVLSLVMSVAANLASDRINQYFEGRRVRVRSSQRKRELRNYLLLKALHDGQIDFAAHYMQRFLMLGVYAFGTIFMLIIATEIDIRFGLRRIAPSEVLNQLPPISDAIAFAVKSFFRVIVLGQLFVVFWSARSVQSQLLRLRHFDMYEEEIVAKFGLNPIGEFEEEIG